MYGAAIWVYKKYKMEEGAQDKYMKWVLKLDRTTQEYLLKLESRRENLANKTRKRAIKYEEKIRKEIRELLKECIKMKDRFMTDTGTGR